MENWTSAALSNFPRLRALKILWFFHDIKMKELSNDFLISSGTTSNVMRALLIKTDLGSLLCRPEVHGNLSPLLRNNK